MGLADPVEHQAELVHLRRGVEVRELGQRAERHGVDARRLLTALRREQRPSSGELLVAEDPSGDRLSLDARHREPLAQLVAGFEQEPHLGHEDSGAGCGTEHVELGRARIGRRRRARIASEDRARDASRPG